MEEEIATYKARKVCSGMKKKRYGLQMVLVCRLVLWLLNGGVVYSAS